MSCEHKLYLYRCARCSAVFGLDDREERYGDQKREDALQIMPCKVCGKGSVEYEGYVYVWR